MLGGGAFELDTTNVTIYANPTRPISSNVIRAIVEAFGWQASSSVVGGTVSVEQLLASGKLSPAGIMDYVQEMTGRLQDENQTEGGVNFDQRISLREESTGGLETGNDTDWVMAYYAPSMAIMFLSFGVAQGARSLLAEERTGTLGRLLTTPTGSNAILGGKLLSTFVLGLLQFSVLIIASSLIFQLDWGDPLAVTFLSLALVAAMTSLGVALAGVVRNENQVNTWGVAILLVFSAISGSFIPRFGFPEWLKVMGWITPNAWALDGFTKLGTGGNLGDIGIELLALSILTVVLFTMGALRLRRRVAV
jgi:ABC-2 type transport system permease protein